MLAPQTRVSSSAAVAISMPRAVKVACVIVAIVSLGMFQAYLIPLTRTYTVVARAPAAGTRPRLSSLRDTWYPPALAAVIIAAVAAIKLQFQPSAVSFLARRGFGESPP